MEIASKLLSLASDTLRLNFYSPIELVLRLSSYRVTLSEASGDDLLYSMPTIVHCSFGVSFLHFILQQSASGRLSFVPSLHPFREYFFETYILPAVTQAVMATTGLFLNTTPDRTRLILPCTFLVLQWQLSP